MAFAAYNSKFVQELSASGIIPKQCTKFTLIVAVNQPVKIISERFATEEECAAIAAAAIRNKEELLLEEQVKVRPSSST